MCACQPVPSGVILCDDCASTKIEAINGQLGQEFTKLPVALTASAIEGLTCVANLWLNSLTKEEK